MKIIERPLYLEKLIACKDSGQMKVITGVRRCGKSYLLTMYKDYLITNGVSNKKIISVDFEKLDSEEIKNKNSFVTYIKNLITDGEKYYLFIDEAQELENAIGVLNAVRASFNVDIYITGSNAKLLINDYVQQAGGRTIEIKMFPLSFSEFLSFKKIDKTNIPSVWSSYEEFVKNGGFPSVVLANEKIKSEILENILQTVLIKDSLNRGGVKKQNESLFYKVARYVFSTIGSSISANNILKNLVAEGNSFSINTIDNYLSILKDSYMIYHALRYDIRGSEYLKTNGKLYVVDIGLRKKFLGDRQSDTGHILENVVYIELIRRGYEVGIGKFDDKEIDFVCTKNGVIKYIQVTDELPKENTRETNNLLLPKNNYRRMIITGAKSFQLKEIAGMEIVHIIDFLLSDF